MEEQSGFEANMFNSSSIIYVLAVPEANLLVFTYTERYLLLFDNVSSTRHLWEVLFYLWLCFMSI